MNLNTILLSLSLSLTVKQINQNSKIILIKLLFKSMFFFVNFISKPERKYETNI